MNKLKVFISYNSREQEFVNCIYNKLSKTTDVHIFSENVKNGERFSTYMDTISEHDLVILVISKEYLESYPCMHEVLLFSKNEEWKEKALYVVMPNANIYSIENRHNYTSYWSEKCGQLESLIEGTPQSANDSYKAQLSEYNYIRDYMGEFLSQVADVRNAPIYSVIEEICEKVNLSRKARFSVKTADGTPESMQQFLIQNFIDNFEPVSKEEIVTKLGISESSVEYNLKLLREKKQIKKEILYSKGK